MNALAALGPFDSVLDVGGNIGQFASRCHSLWPAALITSFEPIPELAAENLHHAAQAQARRPASQHPASWSVIEVGISDRDGQAMIRLCLNQPSATTMQEPGGYRRELGIEDRWELRQVHTSRLDRYADLARGRCLLKIDVEGHEGHVLDGAPKVLALVDTVIVEVQQDPSIFKRSPTANRIDSQLRTRGLLFAGVIGCFQMPAEPYGHPEVAQFDGVWRRGLPYV